MNYEECLRYLADLGHELRGVKFDLVAIQHLLAGLGQPHLRYPTAIVAGTNGKGSTCAMLASILHCAGIRAGLYTSPHLVRVNERIQVGRQEIADEAFADSFTNVAKAVEQLVHQKTLPQRPSFFEFLTATAFLHFAREQVDFAVLEVGMGGRLDATNVTEPRVAIITNVELDHQEFLGNTRAAIAREKAGIIKPHRPVIWGGDNFEAAEVIRRKCWEVGAELLELPRAAEISNVRNHEGCFTFDLALSGSHFRKLAPSLAGRFQIQNATAAVAAALSLRQQGFAIPIEAIDEGLHEARWPGRLEVRPRIVLDGAHNPAAAEALATFVREQFQGRQVRLIYASMRDKAIEEISDLLFPLASEVYLTQTPLARAAQPEEILQRARCRPERVVIEPLPGKALEAAIQASAEEDVILVAGSLFLVGAIEHYQQERETALEQSSPPLSAMRL
jgi:dihydrofolate synthase/folylpolyglutamate synthase